MARLHPGSMTTGLNHFKIMSYPPDYSIPFYSGDLMPKDFSKWLDTLPKGYSYQMNEITKDRGVYTFFIEKS